MRALAVGACLSLVVAAGCVRIATLVYRVPHIDDCGGPIPSTRAVAGDFDKRLRFAIESEGQSEGFQVILQKRGDQLVVIALTRFGNTAFSIVQEDRQMTVTSPMQAVERIAPVNLLRDLYVWPLQAADADERGDVLIAIHANGQSASLTRPACGYRATIVDLDGAVH